MTSSTPSAWFRGVRRLVAGLGLCAGLVLLAACSSIDADVCADMGNMNPQEREARSCDGGFFSSLTQRDSVYRGDDSPRLWTGMNSATNGMLNTSQINRPAVPVEGKSFTGYYGTLRVDYAPDSKQLGTDIRNIQQMRNGVFDPDATTTLKFERADLSFFLKQVLGGILSVNYIAPDEMVGKVTFTTEQPIPKGQVLQVVRDILGRNNYEMQLIDGVYQIGRRETIAAINDVSASGRSGEQTTRIVRISKGSSTEIAQFVKQLVGSDVSIGSANGGDAVVIRAPTSQIDQVARLVQSLVAENFSEDRIAIIPLRRATPGRVAEELTSFFRERSGANKQEAVTITPLESQRALLVAARDARLLAGARRMIDELDRAAGEESSLRIIQLVNAKSDEAVERLKAVFGLGDTAAAAPQAAKSQNASSTQAQKKTSSATSTQFIASPKVNSDDGPDDGSNMNTPGFSGATSGSSSKGSSQNKVDAAFQAFNKVQSVPLAIAPGTNVRIASDPQNNAVMVYSDFETFVKLRDFLKTIDVPEAQVVIEATIVEVTLKDNLQYGVQAYLSGQGFSVGSGQNSSTPPSPATGGFAGGTTTIGSLTLSGFMQALQSVTTVKVISSPYLTVVNGKTARLVVGDQIPFATRTVDSQSNGTSTVSTQVDVKDTGVVLEVTPRIKPNNAVALTVDQQVSKAQDSALNGNLTPVISNRQVKSDVIVDSGSTVLIGGLLQDRLDKTESGVPVLRKMPVLGDVFTQKSNTSTRVELVILITPRVVRNNTEIGEITRALRAQSRVR